jgi:hypothetical protein
MATGACFLPALAVAIHGREVDWDAAYLWLLGAGGSVLLLAMVAGRTTVTGAGGSYDTERLAFESLNPISLGHIAATLLLAVYWRFRFRRLGFYKTLFSLGVAAVSVWGLLAAGSRGPLVACILGLVFFEVVKGGRALIVAIVVGSPLLALLAIDIGELDRLFGSTLFSRLESGMFAADAASSARLVHLESAWGLFLEHPLFGAALEDPQFRIWPHNFVVESFMALGAFGGAVFLFLCGGVLIKSFALGKLSPAHALPGALFVQYFIAGQFSGAIWGATAFWALLGHLIAASRLVPTVVLSRSRMGTPLVKQRSRAGSYAEPLKPLHQSSNNRDGTAAPPTASADVSRCQ